MGVNTRLMENNFVLAYIPQKMDGKKSPLLSFLDSTRQVTRISFQMADLGTKQMDALTNKIQFTVDSIFPPNRYNVTITGNSVVYAKGTNFLIRNLFESVAIAIVLISLLMALLFSSFKMILVSMFFSNGSSSYINCLIKHSGSCFNSNCIGIFFLSLTAFGTKK